MSNSNKRLSKKQIDRYLKKVIQDCPETLRAFVAQEALDHGTEWFFEDLQKSGCASGMISSLIYYCDTHKFYDDHYDEIEELREDYEDCIGSPIVINGDLKNFFAWFSFEEIAFQLGNEMNIY